MVFNNYHGVVMSSPTKTYHVEYAVIGKDIVPKTVVAIDTYSKDSATQIEEVLTQLRKKLAKEGMGLGDIVITDFDKKI